MIYGYPRQYPLRLHKRQRSRSDRTLERLVRPVAWLLFHAHTTPFKYSTFEGEDSGTPVDFTSTPPFKLTGKIGKVSVYLN